MIVRAQEGPIGSIPLQASIGVNTWAVFHMYNDLEVPND